MTKKYNIRIVGGPLENDPEIDKDMAEAVRKASLNLELRFHILLRLEEATGPIYTISVTSYDPTVFDHIGHRLRGIAGQLLKINREKYSSIRYFNRLIMFTEVER